MADYDLDIDYEGSEPDIKQSAQEHREVDPDAEFAEMDIPCDGTLCQRMMPWEQHMGILQVHKVQGSKIIALKL